MWLFFLKPPTVSPTEGRSVGRTCSPKNPTIDIQAKECHTGHVNIVAAECSSSSSSSISKSGNNNFAWLKHVHLCLSTTPALGYPATNDRPKKRSWLVEKNVCASQIALTYIYPAILGILVFFSSSFSRKIHHPWRASIAHPIS